jgi:hypothetical protein
VRTDSADGRWRKAKGVGPRKEGGDWFGAATEVVDGERKEGSMAGIDSLDYGGTGYIGVVAALQFEAQAVEMSPSYIRKLIGGLPQQGL